MLRDYLSLFSVVFQDFSLFSFPMGENIAAGKPMHEPQIWDCLAKAGLRERVRQMPQQLHTNLYRLDEDGCNVSGGEAQRSPSPGRCIGMRRLSFGRAHSRPGSGKRIRNLFRVRPLGARQRQCFHLPPHGQLQKLSRDLGAGPRQVGGARQSRGFDAGNGPYRELYDAQANCYTQ